VASIVEFGATSKTHMNYLLPPTYKPMIAPAIVNAVCSVPDKAHAGLARDSGYGIWRVPAPKRTVAAAGAILITLPNTIDPEDWTDMDVERDCPQIHTINPAGDCLPGVDEGRYYPMSEGRQRELMAMIAFANLAILT